jgi:2-oxo-4-hydroxy-4-carboxy--5-ureidoimidazoline (OHCU) decarboxylase
MSSIGPIPQPGAEFWTRSMDVLRQQQQEMIQKLTLAQQQAAKPVPMKTPPLPGMTTEALQARLNQQLTTMTTTLQRQQQALTEGLAKGNISASLAGVMAGRAEATAEQLRAEMELLKGQIDMLSQLHQQETLKLQQLADRYNEAFSLMSNILKTQHDTTKSIIQNMR